MGQKSSKTPTRQQLAFHHRIGRNIDLAPTHLTVKRLDQNEFLKTAVFSSRPLAEGEVFTVRLEGNSVNLRNFILGLTCLDPARIKSTAHVISLNDTWLYYVDGGLYENKSLTGEAPQMTLYNGDTVGVSWTCQEGLHFYHNSKHVLTWPTKAKSPVQTSQRRRLWAVMQLGFVYILYVIDKFPEGCEINEAIAMGQYERAINLWRNNASITKKDNHGNIPLQWCIVPNSLVRYIPNPFTLGVFIGQSIAYEPASETKAVELLTWMRKSNQIENEGIKELAYFISIYSTFSVAQFEEPSSIFSLLCRCRAGVGDKETVDTIMGQLWPADNNALSLSMRSVRRILRCINHIRPLYLRNESAFCDDMLDIRSELKARRIAEELVRIAEQVPPLTVLCIAKVRDELYHKHRNASVLLPSERLREKIPTAIVDLVHLNHIFNGQVAVGNFATTDEFITENDITTVDMGDPQMESLADIDFASHTTNTFSKYEIEHVRNAFNYIEAPDVLLIALFRLCNKCIKPPPVTPLNSGNMIVDIAEAIDVAKHGDNNLTSHITSIVQCLAQCVYNHEQVTVVQSGSTSVGLKIRDWGEFDFLLEMPVPLNSSEGFQLIQDHDLPAVQYSGQDMKFQHAKRYLFDKLLVLLQDLGKPDNPNTGLPYIQDCYPHSRAPGVCLKLAWYCVNTCKHTVSVDITPCIRLTNHNIDQVFPALRYSPLSEHIIRKEILEQEAVFIPQNNHDLTGKSQWDITFARMNTHIFSHVFQMSIGVKTTTLVAKFYRDLYFPKMLQKRYHSSLSMYKWKESEVVSSHTLQEVVLLEYLKHPAEECWLQDELCDRLISVLSRLTETNTISLYTGKPRPVVNAPPSDRNSLMSWFHGVLDMIRYSLNTNPSNAIDDDAAHNLRSVEHIHVVSLQDMRLSKMPKVRCYEQMDKLRKHCYVHRDTQSEPNQEFALSGEVTKSYEGHMTQKSQKIDASNMDHEQGAGQYDASLVSHDSYIRKLFPLLKSIEMRGFKLLIPQRDFRCRVDYVDEVANLLDVCPKNILALTNEFMTDDWGDFTMHVLDTCDSPRLVLLIEDIDTVHMTKFLQLFLSNSVVLKCADDEATLDQIERFLLDGSMRRHAPLAFTYNTSILSNVVRHRQCNKLSNYEYNDTSLYDAFIWYAESENLSPWIHSLIRHVEDDMGFRLNISARDWLPGHNIIDQIIESTYSCRHMICVLTDSLVDCRWSKLALDVAKQALVTKNAAMESIIFIVFENTLPSKLSLILDRSLRTSTCLIWPEREDKQDAFFDMLKLALQRETATYENHALSLFSYIKDRLSPGRNVKGPTSSEETPQLPRVVCGSSSISEVIPEVKQRNDNTPWLSEEDRRTVTEETGWLTDSVINAATDLLREQFPQVGGLQNCLFGSAPSHFTPASENFVQILNTERFGGHHWVVISSFTNSPHSPAHDEDNRTRVWMYDSLSGGIPNLHVTADVLGACASILNTTIDRFDVIMAVCPQQENSSDCGVHAIANVVSLLFGQDHGKISYRGTRDMRRHLVECLDNRRFSPFPRT